MKRVIIDTNFMLLPYEYGIDIFKEIEEILGTGIKYVISTAILKEIKGVSKVKGPRGMGARLALKMLENKKFEIIPTDLKADDWIVEFALKDPINTVVCTNDKEIRQRLKKTGVRFIVMRSRNHLGVLG